jgi:cytochrome P450
VTPDRAEEQIMSVSTGIPTVPDHVPAELVVDFDFYRDRRFVAGTHEGLAALVAEQVPPIFFSPHNGGHWVVTGYDEMRTVVRDPDTFSNARIVIPTEADPAVHGTTFGPLHLDPPEHSASRRALTRSFPNSAMRGLEPELRRWAVELVERFADAGECEFVSAVAEPFPVTVIMTVIGMPLERLAEFRALAKDFVGDSSPTTKTAAMAEISAAMRELVAQRRARPADDLVSRLLSTDVGNGPPDDEEMHGHLMALFLGGLDTVTTGLSESFRYLAVDQEFQDELRGQPEAIARGAEELLRRGDPSAPGRVVARDATVAGVKFRAGDRMALLFPATGLDPRVYANAGRCSVERKDRPHLAFGSGPHTCWGAPLARLEYQVILEEMLSRVPTFGLDPERPPVFRPSHGHTLGTESLHLVWPTSEPPAAPQHWGQERRQPSRPAD